MSTRKLLWILPFLGYFLFTFWYSNTSGALTQHEVNHYVEALNKNRMSEVGSFRFRKFLEQDTGRQFLMIDTARMLAQNDIRLIWREGFFFIFIMLVLPALAFFIRIATSEVTQLVSPWVMLEDYYGPILATAFVASQPVLLGFVIGVLFVGERDSGTLLALQASPLSLRSFMAYRVLATMLLNVLLTVISVELTGLVSISLIESIIAASLASLGVPVTALIYGVYIKNKVQVIMMMKPIAAWGQLPVLLFFVTLPWQWIGSLFLPLYYPMRFFWTASSDHAEWWLLAWSYLA